MDPDPGDQLNADPDPKHWAQYSMIQCRSGSEKQRKKAFSSNFHLYSNFNIFASFFGSKFDRPQSYTKQQEKVNFHSVL
jgi:uncharacterized protein YprB with RNaseH-like and TPR domain